MIGGVNGGNSLPFFSSVKSDSLLRKSGLVKPLSVGELLSPASIPQSKSLSVGSVERNIDDYNDGGGYFTKSTGKALKGLKFSTGSTLSKLNPSLASTYNLTLAGLTSYGQQSRFINSTAELSTFIERIDRAQQLEGREHPKKLAFLSVVRCSVSKTVCRRLPSNSVFSSL